MGSYPELKGKSVIVTGAGRGIGLAIARRFLGEGAHVMLTDILEGRFAEVLAEAENAQGEAVFKTLDVTSKRQVEETIANAVSRFGRLDLMVCNAGIGEVAPLVEVTEESYDRQMAVNAKGCFLCATAAARQMLRQGGGGRIIMISSGSGKVAPGIVPLGVYAMSKHAVIGLTKSLGIELAAKNILVNCVCAGIVDTPMWDLIDETITSRSGQPKGSFKAQMIAGIPIGRVEDPMDLANMVVYLASDDASYVTGQALNCCGGRVPY